jgi:hypothetical protein
MLYTEAIESGTFSVLNKLMRLPSLQAFSLVGGTALALRYGHHWHKQKYPNQMLAISILNAITYFADADESETPVSYKNQTWPEIKAGIQRIVSNYLR